VSEQVTITFDWLPTLLAAAGVAPDPAYPPDGENILPVLTGAAPEHDRTLFWRYKAQAQRAVRAGRFKYLKINENEFLFDVVDDPRERANLRDKQPEVFARLRQAWADWDSQFIPITDEVFTHGVTPDIQADHYSPERATRAL
jgi:arylsulfatase A-like enzyme